MERGESASKTGRKHIPTRLFKQAVSLSKQARAIEAALDGINPLNAGKKKEEAISMLKKWFPQMENFSGQLKKYKVTINDLWRRMRSWKQGQEASEKGKMKDTMERAKLKSELDNLQRACAPFDPTGSAGGTETAAAAHGKGKVIDISRNFRRPCAALYLEN